MRMMMMMIPSRSIQRFVKQQQHGSNLLCPIGIGRSSINNNNINTNIMRYGTTNIIQSSSSVLLYQRNLNNTRRTLMHSTNNNITTTTINNASLKLSSSLPIHGKIFSKSNNINDTIKSTNTIISKRYYTVPIVVESGSLGERAFDIFSRLLRERIICVHGQIDDPLASVVTAQLLFLEAEQPNKPVYMYINSPGGLVTAGMAIYDTMQYITPDVHTICMGQAASMGSLLLAGGCHGHRYALPNARIMVHQPSGGAQGMASDIDIQAKEIIRTRKRLNTLYVHHTGQSLDRIESVMDRDTFFDPLEAKNFGIIDSILTKRDDTNDDNNNNDTTTTSNDDTTSNTTTTNNDDK